MAEEVLYPYEVIGADALIRHNHKDYRAGDRVELTYDAAVRNRWLLKPLSEDGAFDKKTSVDDGVLRTMRGHEQLEVLRGRKADLEGQLKKVDDQIATAEKTVEEEKKRRLAANRPAPANEGASQERPAPAVEQPEVTQAAPAKK
jgi:hypothetical protein